MLIREHKFSITKRHIEKFGSHASFPSSPNYLKNHDSVSKNSKVILKESLNLNSKELTFKGSFLGFTNRYTKQFTNLAENSNLLQKSLGVDIAEKIQTIISKTKKGIGRIRLDGDSISFKEKGILNLLSDSILYPIVKLPFQLLDFLLTLPLVNKLKPIKTLYNSKFLTDRRMSAIFEKQTNSLQGMFEFMDKNAELLKNSDPKAVKELLINASKMFDLNTGKYNTVHERSLNRIVSGIIPAVFLSYDAHNLSRMCNDDKIEAQKEQKVRFKQEITRILSNSYIQLITLGALTALINGSMGLTIGVTIITILATEVYSRIANGKSIGFLSKEKAKELSQDGKIPEYNFDAKLFETFRGRAPYNTTFGIFMKKGASKVSFTNSKKDKAPKGNNALPPKDDGALINLSTLIKAFIGLAAGGFIAAKFSKTEFYARTLKPFFGFFKNHYKQLVEKPFTMTKSEFNTLISKLEKSGAQTLVEEYKNIMAKSATVKGEEYILNNIARPVVKPMVDLAIGIPKYLWLAITVPYKLTNTLYKAVTRQKTIPKAKTDLEILTNTLKGLKTKLKLSEGEFKQYLDTQVLNSFNKKDFSSSDNSIISTLTKASATVATGGFLVADNYNMVMLKSKGEDERGAKLKAKERVVQETSRLFYSTMFIDTFNRAFSNVYKASLMGMSVVTLFNALISEAFTRKAIGMPVLPHSRDEIITMEHENASKKGIIGGYYRLIAKLSGKKPLSSKLQEKAEKNKKAA
ncbi:MAG: hypothetical protein PHX18_06895 [Candidatus Gastranaerophilales bacterium]|nr:hypothetical protein [Candidatus Gastranaerophilales bacterium]